MDETAASRVLIGPCLKVLSLEYAETPHFSKKLTR